MTEVDVLSVCYMLQSIVTCRKLVKLLRIYDTPVRFDIYIPASRKLALAQLKLLAELKLLADLIAACCFVPPR